MELAFFLLNFILALLQPGSQPQTGLRTPAVVTNANLKSYIYSPKVTDWGTWGEWAFCKTGDLVVGVKLQVEDKQGKGDDTALNSIHVRCESADGQRSYEIHSKDGFWGDWTPYTRCPGTGIGFQLRSEEAQGKGDDTAAVDFQLLCLQGNQESFVGKSGKLDWGRWTSVQKCPSGQYLCGIQTQVEDPQGGGDDTALNNVNMACCSTDQNQI